MAGWCPNRCLLSHFPSSLSVLAPLFSSHTHESYSFDSYALYKKFNMRTEGHGDSPVGKAFVPQA